MRIHGIYRITNIVNGKIYIGQTLNPSKRWSLHKSESKKDKPSMAINYAMKKYGIHNFTFEIIASCLDLQSANDTEEIIIVQEKSHVKYGMGYNVSNGGSNVSPTEETRKKLSESLKGKPKSEEHKNKLKNKINSKETRLKISQGNKGKIVSEESKQKMSKSRIGRKYSNESKSKISCSKKGRTWKLIDGKRVWSPRLEEKSE